MKRFAVPFFIALLLAVVMSACAQKPPESSGKDVTAGVLSSSEKADTTEQKPPASSSGQADTSEQKPPVTAPPVTTSSEADPFEDYCYQHERPYPDELFNEYNLSKIVSWEDIYAANDKLNAENPYYRHAQLPPLYLMIKELGITKEEFIQANEELSEEQIEVLFSDKSVEEIQQELKADSAFFYKGYLYSPTALMNLESSQLKEMAKEGGLNEHLEQLQAYSEWDYEKTGIGQGASCLEMIKRKLEEEW